MKKENKKIRISEKKEVIGELCSQIKTKLEEQGRKHLILWKSFSNNDIEYDDVDIELPKVEFDYDEDTLTETISQTIPYGIKAYLAYSMCGSYTKMLVLDGVIIEDNILKLYLTDVCYFNEDYDEWSNRCEYHTYKVGVDQMMDESYWWTEDNVKPFPTTTDYADVFRFYLDLLSGNCKEYSIPTVEELKRVRKENLEKMNSFINQL